MSTHKANISKEDIVVEGSVDLGYEKVQAAFEDLFRKAQRLKLIEDTYQWCFFPNQKSRKLKKIAYRDHERQKVCLKMVIFYSLTLMLIVGSLLLYILARGVSLAKTLGVP